MSYLKCCLLQFHQDCLLSNHRIYPKYSDTSTPYHICSKIWTSTIHCPMLCLKIAGWVANSLDPDETPHSAASHLGLYCLLRPVCPNIYGKYGRFWISIKMIFVYKNPEFWNVFLSDLADQLMSFSQLREMMSRKIVTEEYFTFIGLEN